MGNKGNDMWGNWKGWSSSSDDPREQQKGHSDAGGGGTSNKGCLRVIAIPAITLLAVVLFIF